MQYTHNSPLLLNGQHFDKNSPRELLQYAIGGMLYMPATRLQIANEIISQKNPTIKTICLDLEDAVGDDSVEEAMIILKNNLQKLYDAIENETLSIENLPLIFIRVRNPEQLEEIKNTFDEKLYSVITGFNFPKFDNSNAAQYLRTFDSIKTKTPLYFNPILESRNIMYKQTRLTELAYLHRKLTAFSERILSIRVGATDFCNIFGIRRKPNQSIHDVRVVANCFGDIINFFGKNFVVSGPVWEYFGGHDELDGLKKELEEDQLNGFFGKTCIHPTQLKLVAESGIVSEKDYMDALNILGMNDGVSGVAKSYDGKRMNEVKTHINWAKKIISKSTIYGVKKG